VKSQVLVNLHKVCNKNRTHIYRAYLKIVKNLVIKQVKKSNQGDFSANLIIKHQGDFSVNLIIKHQGDFLVNQTIQNQENFSVNQIIQNQEDFSVNQAIKHSNQQIFKLMHNQILQNKHSNYLDNLRIQINHKLNLLVKTHYLDRHLKQHNKAISQHRYKLQGLLMVKKLIRLKVNLQNLIKAVPYSILPHNQILYKQIKVNLVGHYLGNNQVLQDRQLKVNLVAHRLGNQQLLQQGKQLNLVAHRLGNQQLLQQGKQLSLVAHRLGNQQLLRQGKLLNQLDLGNKLNNQELGSKVTKEDYLVINKANKEDFKLSLLKQVNSQLDLILLLLIQALVKLLLLI